MIFPSIRRHRLCILQYLLREQPHALHCTTLRTTMLFRESPRLASSMHYCSTVPGMRTLSQHTSSLVSLACDNPASALRLDSSTLIACPAIVCCSREPILLYLPFIAILRLQPIADAMDGEWSCLAVEDPVKRVATGPGTVVVQRQEETMVER